MVEDSLSQTPCQGDFHRFSRRGSYIPVPGSRQYPTRFAARRKESLHDASVSSFFPPFFSRLQWTAIRNSDASKKSNVNITDIPLAMLLLFSLYPLFAGSNSSPKPTIPLIMQSPTTPYSQRQPSSSSQ